MKIFVLSLCILASFSVYSATVKITSFNFVRIANSINHPMAELCGKVEGIEETPTFIRVIVDPGSKRPGIYNTIADDKGIFCLSVITYRGTAEASIFGNKSSFKARITNVGH